jgi:TPR repeat protein
VKSRLEGWRGARAKLKTKAMGEGWMNFLKAASLALALVLAGATFALSLMADAAQQQRSEGEDLYHRGFYKEAMAWWTDHAAKGDTESAYRLGVEYMDGKSNVTQRDYDKARQYHMQAALAGDRRSMMDIGSMYEYGLGTAADIKQAASWYEHAANYGYGPAQYNFATLLETGDAGRKDEVEALKYYILAANQGIGGVPYDKTTKRVVRGGEGPIDLLIKRLTKEQLADAADRAQAFKPLSGPLKL